MAARIDFGSVSSRLGAIVGRAVRRLRRAREWSQDETAEYLRRYGLPWSTAQLTSLEIGRRNDIGLSEAVLLSEFFGVPLVELIEGYEQVELGPSEAPWTERPAALVRADISGDLPEALRLSGPLPELDAAPEYGPGPFYEKDQPPDPDQYPWRKRLDPAKYGIREVEAARRFAIDVQRVRDAAKDLWDGRSFDVEHARRLADWADAEQIEASTTSALVGAARDRAGREITNQLADELRCWLRDRPDA